MILLSKKKRLSIEKLNLNWNKETIFDRLWPSSPKKVWKNPNPPFGKVPPEVSENLISPKA